MSRLAKRRIRSYGVRDLTTVDEIQRRIDDLPPSKDLVVFGPARTDHVWSGTLSSVVRHESDPSLLLLVDPTLERLIFDENEGHIICFEGDMLHHRFPDRMRRAWPTGRRGESGGLYVFLCGGSPPVAGTRYYVLRLPRVVGRGGLQGREGVSVLFQGLTFAEPPREGSS